MLRSFAEIRDDCLIHRYPHCPYTQLSLGVAATLLDVFGSFHLAANRAIPPRILTVCPFIEVATLFIAQVRHMSMDMPIAQAPATDFSQQQQQQQQQYYGILPGGQYSQLPSQQPSTSQLSGQQPSQPYSSSHRSSQPPSGTQTPTSHMSPAIPSEPQVVVSSASPAPLSCPLPVLSGFGGDLLAPASAEGGTAGGDGVGDMTGDGLVGGGYGALDPGAIDGLMSLPADLGRSSGGGSSTSGGGGSMTAKRGRQPAVAPAAMAAATAAAAAAAVGGGGPGGLGGQIGDVVGAGPEGGEGGAGGPAGQTANPKALYHTESKWLLRYGHPPPLIRSPETEVLALQDIPLQQFQVADGAL